MNTESILPIFDGVIPKGNPMTATKKDSPQAETVRKYVGEVSSVRGSGVDISSTEPVPSINTLSHPGEIPGIYMSKQE